MTVTTCDRPTLEQRYWAKVDVRGPDECWPWTASTYHPSAGSGHGKMILPNGGFSGAHRVGWALAHGRPVPEGKIIRHLCNNPVCQNPAHLEEGTHADNAQDKVKSGRARGGAVGLSEEDVRKIRVFLGEKRSHREIAGMFGVTRQMISHISTGRNWAGTA